MKIGVSLHLDWLDVELRWANAWGMRCFAAAGLALFLVLSAAAQTSKHPYLVRLNTSEFPGELRSKGVTPLRHRGQLWAVLATDEDVLRQTTEDVVPASNVTIEVQPGSAGITQAIIHAGGIVTHTYRSVSAVAAIVPTSKVGELQHLPGVKRLSKGRVYRTFPNVQE